MNKARNYGKNEGYLLLGAFTGLVGIGIQHYNPIEPYLCTHMCPIVLGIVFLIGSFAFFYAGREVSYDLDRNNENEQN
jgi:hypothetical protein